jgi:hypothetical protein
VPAGSENQWLSVWVQYTDGEGHVERLRSELMMGPAAVADTLAPSVTSIRPAEDTMGVTGGQDIVMTFSEPIKLGTGAIVLKNAAGSVVATYDVASSTHLSISGSALTIAPTAVLGDSRAYSVAFAFGSIKDLNGNSYADVAGYDFFAPAAPLEGIGKTADVIAYSWKAHTLLSGVELTAGTHSSSTDPMGAASFKAITQSNLSLSASRTVPADEAQATTNAVNLQDAIAILKMIVGLNVNGANQPLSPYQALAADFDGNSRVELNDAIGVLKHVVGLTGTGTPKPEWRFVDEASAAVVAIKDTAALSPGQPPAINLDLTGADATVQVGLVGYLRGDVDGSFAGAAGALDLDDAQPGYFTALVAEQPALNLAQFGIYGVS